MKILKRLSAIPITSLMSAAMSAQQAPADQAAAARPNADWDRQAQQQCDAAVRAPSVRLEVQRVDAYPALLFGTSCFRITCFVLDVPDSLPDASKTKVHPHFRAVAKRPGIDKPTPRRPRCIPRLPCRCAFFSMK
ncbi:hypothetical protein [Burkholderia ambifaria]|uniref:hypothetical protein n=1 Tax=Burkholderia ambifaria TaxID=152480 RepID=UPI001F499C75|nr:hypothetical protein [Burkholderia ambifaria]